MQLGLGAGMLGQQGLGLAGLVGQQGLGLAGLVGQQGPGMGFSAMVGLQGLGMAGLVGQEGLGIPAVRGPVPPYPAPPGFVWRKVGDGRGRCLQSRFSCCKHGERCSFRVIKRQLARISEI